MKPMTTTIVCLLLLAAIATSATAIGVPTTEPKYPVHWMPTPTERCPALVREYTYPNGTPYNYTAWGILSKVPNWKGEYVCFVPRRSGSQDQELDQAVPQAPSDPPVEPPVNETPVNETPTEPSVEPPVEPEKGRLDAEIVLLSPAIAGRTVVLRCGSGTIDYRTSMLDFDFGDGMVLYDVHPRRQTLTHTYREPGTYEATCVIDNYTHYGVGSTIITVVPRDD